MREPVDSTTTYVLPLRRAANAGPLDRELIDYLRWLATRCEVVVADGSDEREFAEAERALEAIACHVAPDDDLRVANGKVHGVLSGLRRARTPWLIIGDDDVRYDDAALRRVESLLVDHDLVVPQNYFDPCPWHAALELLRTAEAVEPAAPLPSTSTSAGCLPPPRSSSSSGCARPTTSWRGCSSEACAPGSLWLGGCVAVAPTPVDD